MDVGPQLLVITDSAQETESAGLAFAASLRPGDVVTLTGELGAGKTTFVRGVVAGLGGAADQVSSPTFALVNTYKSPTSVIHHVDGYRIRSEAELDEMGFDEYLDGKSIVLIEWPDRVRSALPKETIDVALDHRDANKRQIRILSGGTRPGV